MQAYIKNLETIRAELPHADRLFDSEGNATTRSLGGFMDGLKDAAKALADAYGRASGPNSGLIGAAFHDPEAVQTLARHAYNYLPRDVAVNVWTLLLLGVAPRRLCELFVDGFKAASDERPTI